MIFNLESIAQVTGYILWKEGGALPLTKLLKLVYLADREALLTMGDTLTGDSYLAMKFDPMPLRTYCALVNNKLPSGWVVCNAHNARLVKEVNEQAPLETFNLLYPAAQDVLDCALQSYSKQENATFPEWENCKGLTIEITDILEAEGKSQTEIKNWLEAIEENNELIAFSASMS